MADLSNCFDHFEWVTIPTSLDNDMVFVAKIRDQVIVGLAYSNQRFLGIGDTKDTDYDVVFTEAMEDLFVVVAYYGNKTEHKLHPDLNNQTILSGIEDALKRQWEYLKTLTPVID